MNIIILNGMGTSGKGELVKAFQKYIHCYQLSIIDYVKELAKTMGWDGSKTEKDRWFLANLKSILTSYNDSPYKEVMKKIQSCIDHSNVNGIKEYLICVDMRERQDIERVEKELDVTKVLVVRDTIPKIDSNHADANVFDIKYDYVIENNGTLEELEILAKSLLKVIVDKPRIQTI
jgi:chloramphenicol 3-O-phosphotransferase